MGEVKKRREMVKRVVGWEDPHVRNMSRAVPNVFLRLVGTAKEVADAHPDTNVCAVHTVSEGVTELHVRVGAVYDYQEVIVMPLRSTTVPKATWSLYRSISPMPAYRLEVASEGLRAEVAHKIGLYPSIHVHGFVHCFAEICGTEDALIALVDSLPPAAPVQALKPGRVRTKDGTYSWGAQPTWGDQLGLDEGWDDLSWEDLNRRWPDYPGGDWHSPNPAKLAPPTKGQTYYGGAPARRRR